MRGTPDWQAGYIMARPGAHLSRWVKGNEASGRSSWSTTGDQEDVQRKKLRRENLVAETETDRQDQTGAA